MSASERWLAPLNAALRQWHWTFYRAAAAAWLMALASGNGGTPALRLGPLTLGLDHPAGLYWGAWLGLAAVAGEWLLNPFVREGLRTPGRQEVLLRTAGLAVATTGLFALTHNFWLCLLCQVIVDSAVAAWWPEVTDRIRSGYPG
jgi:hypothetical protein